MCIFGVRPFWKSLLAVLAGSTVTVSAAQMTLQVEATSTSAPDSYAPVNFAGSATLTSAGVVYHALSTAGSATSSTLSGHASTVRTRLLTASGTAVSDIYCLTANDFINNNVKPAAASTGATKPNTTTLTGNGIKVVNNSWIGGTSSYDLDIRRRLDYMIQVSDVIMVSGAVSTSSATPLVWYNYNGIAVRGTQAFDGASATGKTHADLWGPETVSGADEEASYTTPGVAGYAAALVQNAKDSSSTNGQKHLVVKSLLMTGASKTNFSTTSGGFTSWTRNTANNLDTDAGAGRVDYATSKYIQGAGEKAMAAISGSIIASPAVSTTAAGWTYGTISSLSAQALVFYSSVPFEELTATLCWDVTVAESGANRINTTADVFANLALELRYVSYANGVYTLGSSTGLTGLSSTATNDNVQHLYYTGNLAGGYYAFVTNGISVPSTTYYGLSYDFTAVPEPAAVLLLAWGAVALLRRRR